MVLIAGLLTVADTLRHSPPQLAGGAGVSTTPWPTGTGRPTAPADPRQVVLRPRPVTVHTTGFLSWALLDRRTGAITGSPNLADPSDTASMIKVWIAADYLRRTPDQAGPPSTDRLRQLSTMIRDSDNVVAEEIHRLNGASESITRLVRICRLTDTRAHLGWWSNTVVSARDTVRMGACIADGRAAGPLWTGWLLDEMRQVRGAGDFGLRRVLPPAAAAGVAVKNGWLLRAEDQLWHVSCLAIGEQWVLGVLARYPGRLGLEHGTGLCRAVGEQLIS